MTEGEQKAAEEQAKAKQVASGQGQRKESQGRRGQESGGRKSRPKKRSKPRKRTRMSSDGQAGGTSVAAESRPQLEYVVRCGAMRSWA